jgi:L-rhamnose mutarotase
MPQWRIERENKEHDMQRVGFVIKVRQEKLEAYKESHKHVWPEMQQALSDAGWTNYSLFAREDGTLFGYLETEDFERSLAEMETKEVNARWQETMKQYFEDIGDKRPDESFLVLEEVFHLD